MVEGVEAGADLLGVATEVGEGPAVNAHLDVVVRADCIERCMRHVAERPTDCTGVPRGGLPGIRVVIGRAGGGLDISAKAGEARSLVQETPMPLVDNVREVGVQM